MFLLLTGSQTADLVVRVAADGLRPACFNTECFSFPFEDEELVYYIMESVRKKLRRNQI